jgi:hypothetical protein
MADLPGYPVYDCFGESLIRTIGSFWYHYFGDRDKLTLHYRSLGHRQGQAYLDYLTAVATVGRFDIPVFKSEDWYLLVLKQSDRGRVLNVYGQADLTYNGSYKYEDQQTAEPLFPLPDVDFFGQLADIPFTIYNNVLYPSKSWTCGLDFEIDYDRNLIRFRADPFESEYVAKREVYGDDGQIEDEEIGLWVYMGEFDLDMVYKQWGFVVTEQLQSSEGYKDVVNALWDSYVLGSNMAAFELTISAALGIPIVLEATETVVDVAVESTRNLVITDKHVYSFSLNANITVSVGDVLFAGQQMSDALKIVDLSGYAPDYDDFPAVSFGANYLSGGYFAELIFENMMVDVEYLGTDEDDKAVVVFRIGGFPGDVDDFFEQAQLIGKQPGNKTLAELLDTRANPVSQPLPAYLPAQLNPLQFVLDNIMKNHLILIKIRTSAIDPNAPGMGIFRYLRNVVPPHTAFIVFVEITPDADIIDLSYAGDDQQAGVQEVPTRFGAAVLTAEEINPADAVPVGGASYEDIMVRVYKVSEWCE